MPAGALPGGEAARRVASARITAGNPSRRAEWVIFISEGPGSIRPFASPSETGEDTTQKRFYRRRKTLRLFDSGEIVVGRQDRLAMHVLHNDLHLVYEEEGLGRVLG